MTESVILEFSGNQRESTSRMYYYGTSGVRVLDNHNATRRLYRFDPSTNIMTENDPKQPQKILRRFVFDNYGMLEETYAFGQPPRTFKYEAGGRQIVMREGGDYGAVGKTFTFEDNGVAETAFGRDGGTERVYVFEPGRETITIRSGGWYGDIERTLVFERLNISVFNEPEAFLQFLMFTEKSQREVDAEIDEQVAKIRESAPGRSKYAYNGPRHTAEDTGRPAPSVTAGRSMGMSRPTDRESPEISTASRSRNRNDSIIDFIGDDTSSQRESIIGNPQARSRSAAIPFEERYQRGDRNDDDNRLRQGMSSRISIEERFRSSREEDRTLTKGKSADIPLQERFQDFDDRNEKLTPGRSAQISYEERKTGRRME